MLDTQLTEAEWPTLVAGIDQEVPLVYGITQRYVNLDNAASTPPLQAVREMVDHMAGWYSSVHRGSGFKSQLCSALYGQARELVLEFVHADPAEMVAIFTIHPEL